MRAVDWIRQKSIAFVKNKDEVDAGKLAEELVELNTSRKALTEKESRMPCSASKHRDFQRTGS